MHYPTRVIAIQSEDGHTFAAHITLPRETTNPVPCVIVIQEIFGVNDDIREKCAWLASQGFIAIAPDLFWRTEHHIQLSDQVPEELERAFKLFNEFNVELGVQDLKSTLNVINKEMKTVGKVGCLGYCLGGKLAYLLGCQSNIDASVSYYGVGIENMLSDANKLKNNMMIHIAKKDGFVPPEAQEKIDASLSKNNKVKLHFYDDVDHAFTRTGGDNYSPEAAKIADDRTIEFLKDNLIISAEEGA